jgi:hypothetical protein
MSGKLTDIPTGKLLEKFGAGNHKPGLEVLQHFKACCPHKCFVPSLILQVSLNAEKNISNVSELVRIKRKSNYAYIFLEDCFKRILINLTK